jgi:hypothetical protein
MKILNMTSIGKREQAKSRQGKDVLDGIERLDWV